MKWLESFSDLFPPCLYNMIYDYLQVIVSVTMEGQRLNTHPSSMKQTCALTFLRYSTSGPRSSLPFSTVKKLPFA